ncbi:hypothetical protein Dimus_010415 [Dionaea muscipula]
MEVEIVEQNISTLDNEEELFGIDYVDAFIDIVVEKTVGDIFKDIADKVDMDLAEKVVRELEKADKEKSLLLSLKPTEEGEKLKDSVIKKLNCLSTENHNHSNIIEHKIQFSENFLVRKMEKRFDENDERMKNMEGAVATILES